MTGSSWNNLPVTRWKTSRRRPLVALGYNRLGPWDDEPADFAQDRFDQLDDIVTTTSQVFLGMTLGCARCHNHKFDPLTARDYYGMVAVFNGLVRPKPAERSTICRSAPVRSWTRWPRSRAGSRRLKKRLKR